MSAHPVIKQTAKTIIDEFGVHSAGSAALVGNTSLSVALENKIAEFLGAAEAILYPTGWAAGFGVIKGFVRSTDHVVLDVLAHTCLQEGAMASTRNVYRFRHLQVEDCRRVLTQIRERDTENGIMVVTEGLFSMDSDTPDLLAMQELCNEFNATPDGRCRPRPGQPRRRRQGPHRHPEHDRQDRSGDGQLLQDLRLQRRLRDLPHPGAQGVPALLQPLVHLLQRPVADAGGHRAEGDGDHRDPRGRRTAPEADEQRAEPARPARRARLRGLRGSFRHRLRQDGQRGPWRGW